MSALLDMGPRLGRFRVRTFPVRGKNLHAGDSFLIGANGPLVTVDGVEPGLTGYGQRVLRDSAGEPVSVDPERFYEATRLIRSFTQPCMLCETEVSTTHDVVAYGVPGNMLCTGCGTGQELIITVG